MESVGPPSQGYDKRNRTQSEREAEREFERGVFSLCVGLKSGTNKGGNVIKKHRIYESVYSCLVLM